MVRRYRVAASCFEPDTTHSVEKRRESLRCHLSELLAEQMPDLVVVPELAITPDFERLPDLGAEPIAGPTVSYVAELAAKFNSNIVIPILEKDGDARHNTAVFVSRDGRNVGRYRKCVPTRAEMELGIIPGELHAEPIIVDGLSIGTAICYDENYPDLMWNWINKRVDLIVFPSYTYAGGLIGAWSLTCGVPLVGAFPWESVIYDRDGSILVDGGTWTTIVRFGNHPAWIACELDMQSRIYHLDYNQAKIAEMRRRYGGKLDIRLLVREARMQVRVVSDELSIAQVEKDMELIPLQTYISETRVLADSRRCASDIDIG